MRLGEEFWLFTVAQDDGDGVVATGTMVAGVGMVMLPLMTSQPHLIPKMREAAQRIADEEHKTIRLFHYARTEVDPVEVLSPRAAN